MNRVAFLFLYHCLIFPVNPSQAFCTETLISVRLTYSFLVNKQISSHLTSRFGSRISSYISPSSPGSGGRTTTGEKKQIHMQRHVTGDMFLVQTVTEYNEINYLNVRL